MRWPAPALRVAGPCVERGVLLVWRARVRGGCGWLLPRMGVRGIGSGGRQLRPAAAAAAVHPLDVDAAWGAGGGAGAGAGIAIIVLGRPGHRRVAASRALARSHTMAAGGPRARLQAGQALLQALQQLQPPHPAHVHACSRRVVGRAGASVQRAQGTTRARRLLACCWCRRSPASQPVTLHRVLNNKQNAMLKTCELCAGKAAAALPSSSPAAM